MLYASKQNLSESVNSDCTKKVYFCYFYHFINHLNYLSNQNINRSTRQQLLVAALTDSHKLVFTEDSPSLRSVSEIRLFPTAKVVCGEGQLFACRLIYAIHKNHKQTNKKKTL